MANVLKMVAGVLLLLAAALCSWRQPAVALPGSLQLWCLLGALLGGALLGHGLRGFGVRHREQGQARFYQNKVDAAFRENDERNLRLKMLEARVSALEPQVAQLRERDKALQEAHEEIERLRSVPPAIVAASVAAIGGAGGSTADDSAGISAIVNASDVESVEVAPSAAESRPWPGQAEADDLELIHGVGPKLARFLNSRGITLFSQVAEWKSTDIDRLEAELPQFRGRIRREGWVSSAAAEHRKKYGSVWTGAS